MDNSFKENFNYFAAFLAALFGLGVFKDELSKIKVLLISTDFDLVQLSIPFIVLMLFATYIGALAMVSRNFTFRPFPLTKILERVSYSMVFFGLIYPFLVTVVMLVSVILPTILQVGAEKVILAASTFNVIIGAYLSYRFASIRLKNKYEIRLAELRNIVVETEAINLKKTSPYEVVMLFHQFSTLCKAILRLRGYGYANDDSYTLGKTMESIGIFNKKDLNLVQKLRTFKNYIAHNSIQAKDSELKTARLELEQLISKLKDEIMSLEQSII